MEVWLGEVLEEDVVANYVGDIGGGGGALGQIGGTEEGVRDGEESEGGTVGKIDGNGGGGKEVVEVREVGVGR